MGIILPQETEILITSNNQRYYFDKGYDIPTYKKGNSTHVKRGTKITVHSLDLTKGTHAMVKVQCDKCGKIYMMPYKDYLTNYCVQKIGKLFCFDCINPSMSEYEINSENKWRDKEYVKNQLKQYIEKHGNLVGWTRNRDGDLIARGMRANRIKVEEMCTELGYDYLTLKNLKYDYDYISDYENFKKELNKYMETHDVFPTLKVFRYELKISETLIQKFGGIDKIKSDLGYTDNEYVDDNGFYNRSHYEYMVAQFLIHNNITYKREQHPFVYPYQNLRSDFTFVKTNGEKIHLEVWGYFKDDCDGSRSKAYCKRKEDKIKLYKENNINLIQIEPSVFSNSFDKIQKRLKKILSPVLSEKLETIPYFYMTSPTKISDNELFNAIMKLSPDGIALPMQSDYTDENRYLFNEAIKRFGNYNKFARHFHVVTNRKRGYWNKETALDRMIEIHQKYGYMPVPNYLKVNAKEDSLFCGLLNGIKDNYESTVDAYTILFDNRVTRGNPLGKSDVEYLQRIVDGQYFHKSLLTETIVKRANDTLNVVGSIAA